MGVRAPTACTGAACMAGAATGMAMELGAAATAIEAPGPRCAFAQNGKIRREQPAAAIWAIRFNIGTLNQGSFCTYIVLDAEARRNVSRERMRWKAPHMAGVGAFVPLPRLPTT